MYACLIWTAALSIRSSEIFNLVTKFRELYVILTVSVGDAKWFMGIYVYILFAIAAINQTKFMRHPEDPEYNWAEAIGY